MSEGRSPRSRSLTGIWEGIYSYPVDGPSPVAFTATLIEAGGTLSGSVHEPCMASGYPGHTLLFTLNGSRGSGAVNFVKTYNGTNLRYRHPIFYEGSVNDDATEIEGVWSIPGNWSGRFLMTRSGGQPGTAVEREGAERATDTMALTPAR